MRVALPPGLLPEKKRSKFGNTSTNGYASKKEAAYAAHLDWLQKAGQIAGYLTQVPIRLSPGVKYVCDFLIINTDGTVRFVEVKGFERDVWKLKLKLLREMRPEVYERLEIIK